MFHTDKQVVLIGAGPIGYIPPIARDLDVIAVDGGLDYCMHHGLKPAYFLGDMDSASAEARQFAEQNHILSHLLDEQDTTDFEKSLMQVDARGYFCFGFLDGRFDHTLATLHVVQKYTHKRPIILYGREDVILVVMDDITLSLPIGERVSILPLDRVSFKSSKGLYWSLDNIKMAPGTQIGVSNKTSENLVQITLADNNRGQYLLILPNYYFEDVLKLTGGLSEPK